MKTAMPKMVVYATTCILYCTSKHFDVQKIGPLSLLKELRRRVHQQMGEMYALDINSHPEGEFSCYHGWTAGVMTLFM
jgi:hypothetical protein